MRSGRWKVAFDSTRADGLKSALRNGALGVALVGPVGYFLVPALIAVVEGQRALSVGFVLLAAVGLLFVASGCVQLLRTLRDLIQGTFTTEGRLTGVWRRKPANRLPPTYTIAGEGITWKVSFPVYKAVTKGQRFRAVSRAGTVELVKLEVWEPSTDRS